MVDVKHRFIETLGIIPFWFQIVQTVEHKQTLPLRTASRFTFLDIYFKAEVHASNYEIRMQPMFENTSSHWYSCQRFTVACHV